LKTKPIEWKQKRYSLDGNIKQLRLFSISYDGLLPKGYDGPRYRLRTTLPARLVVNHYETEEQAQEAAPKILARFIEICIEE